MSLFADWTITVVAWWGAVVATLVLLWDIYKWRTTGPRIYMTVLPNRKALGDPELEGKTLILVHATNVGDRATTLELMSFVWYANLWQRFRKRPAQQILVRNPGRHRSFPYKLEVGERWDGIAFQTEEHTKLARSGYLYCRLACSSFKRPVTRRVRIPEEETS